MSSPEPFVSFAQNGEDIVLWRALGSIEGGRYVDVGAADPVHDSVTRAFYLRGWRGLNIEPVPALAEALRRERPGDVTLGKGAADRPDPSRTFYVVESTGLSTLQPEAARRGEELGYPSTEVRIAVDTLDGLLDEAGFAGGPIHFCKIDVEGAEEQVLAGFSLSRWKPWVLVVEATRPTSTEASHDTWEPRLLGAGYRLCLFDGLNRFYAAPEHPELVAPLSIPANVLDGWDRYDGTLLAQEARVRDLESRRDVAERLDRVVTTSRSAAQEALAWRARARAASAEREVVARQVHEVRAALDATRRTIAWRVTGPVRRIEASAAVLSSHAPPAMVRNRTGRRPAPPPNGNEADSSLSSTTRDERARRASRSALGARLQVAARLLHGPSDALGVGPGTCAEGDLSAALRDLRDAVGGTALAPLTVAWLVATAAHGAMPDESELDVAVQRLELGGVEGLGSWVEAEWERSWAAGTASDTALEVFEGVAVDVTHTASWNLHTGVQRVVRESAVRWVDDHGAVLVAWDPARGAMFALPPAEVARFRRWAEHLDGDPTARHDPLAATDVVLLPWRTVVVVPEIASEPWRAERYRALARSGFTRRLAGIGYDMIPMTANETLAVGMSDAFSELLGVVKYMERLSAISESSAGEFRAFTSMLAAQGLGGPAVEPHLLPTVAPAPDDERVAALRQELDLGSIPVVLVVGSHEPRKNHVAVLLAAERLWQEGLPFHLVFIGGSGWRSERFEDLVGDLVAGGRPVQIVKRATEEVLWAAYRLARFSVFPSLAEGFGLPVAESLVTSTPVITSKYGSMAEIGRGGGAVLVDPRSVEEITAAMRTLLTDDERLALLRRGADRRTWRSWDDYAGDLWAYFTG